MPRPRARSSAEVSPGNPCPFLRALVAEGRLDGATEPLVHVAATVADVAKSGDGEPTLPVAAIYAIALIAHGLGPLSVARTQHRGLRPDALRDGPLDKHGAGSGILDASGHVDGAELDRLDTFARLYPSAAGRREGGLGADELGRYMDANFERAAGRRRLVDRRLMDGEWPVLLKVMGKDGPDGRYLSVAEVRSLFVDRRLPRRMLARLPPVAGAART
jgi:hypothetical protein